MATKKEKGTKEKKIKEEKETVIEVMKPLTEPSEEKLTPGYTTGTITKIASGARNPYLIDNGNLGLANDSCIVSNNASSPTTYTVASGDTLKGIAAKYGMTWQELYAKNKFVIGNNPDLIYPGQVFTIK